MKRRRYLIAIHNPSRLVRVFEQSGYNLLYYLRWQWNRKGRFYHCSEDGDETSSQEMILTNSRTMFVTESGLFKKYPWLPLRMMEPMEEL